MNYIGSKYSLLDFLQSTIAEVTNIQDGQGHTFADLFAGTGIVGATYKSLGYNVISNDIQYYSYVLNKHYIENCPPMSDNFSSMLDSLDGIEGFVFKNYCVGSGSERNYFTDFNGKKCDAIRSKLEEMYSTNKISSEEYFYYLASLIDSIDRFANTASVYGAFLKHVKKAAQKQFSLKMLPVIEGPKGKVYNQDISYLIKNISGDILYLDPPYNARQYCTNYHVLETIAKYDNPIISGKTGLRNYSEQKSGFCSKRTVCDLFDNVVANAKFKYIFLSYNNEGLMSLDNIKNIMSKYGKYYCFTKDYKRFKADKDKNRNILANSTQEYLHCIIKE